MPTTKLRAPENFGGLSLEGRAVTIGEDGSYHADHRDIATLTSHGFTPWTDDPTGGDVRTMTREQLIEHVIAMSRQEISKLDTETIRRQILVMSGESDVEDQQVPTEAEIAAALIDPHGVTEERIAGMKRNELFAYLAANKVSSPPPVSNDELRARALDTLRKQAA